MYLGIRAVVAKSFARIHVANLINAGILPLTFADPGDYDRLNQEDALTLSGIHAGMDSGRITMTDNTTGASIELVCQLSQRQKQILLSGGLLGYTREGGK